MSPSTLSLRRARPDDADAMAALMNDAMVYPGLMQLPYTDAAFWRERLAQPGGPAQVDLSLVALHEGQVVGSAGLHQPIPAIRRRHAAYFGISVAAAWQRRGVGSLLLGALCTQADDWLGLLRLELTVFTDNAPAVALYRKHGFEVEGRHRAYALRGGVFEDVFSMARLHPRQPRLPTGPGPLPADQSASLSA